MIIGIDMGGTHIDGAAIENGVLIASVKHQVDHGNYFASIWQCLEELLSQVDKDAVERYPFEHDDIDERHHRGATRRCRLNLTNRPGVAMAF